MPEINDDLNFIVPQHPAGMPDTEVMRVENVLRVVAGDEKTFQEDNIHKVESISATVSELTIPLGGTVHLEIVPEPLVGNVPDLVWETSDPTAIYFEPSVNSVQGVIVGMKEGKYTVTATNPLDNAQTVTWEITIEGGVNVIPPLEEGDNKQEGEEGN